MSIIFFFYIELFMFFDLGCLINSDYFLFFVLIDVLIIFLGM